MSELTSTAVERACFECSTFGQAAAQLVVILKDHPPLHAACKRGRLLRKFKDLAATTVSVTQAAKELGMTGMELRALLDSDEEIRDVWDQQRRRLRMDMVQAMVIQAKQGQPKAVRYVENFLRSEQAPVGFDYRHVPMPVLAEIIGKTRQTLYAWTCNHGCPRNADTTYDLVEFFQWFNRWQQNKAPAGRQAFHRETCRRLQGTSSDASDTPTKTEVTGRQ
jgi:hypothetical protein